MIFVNFVFAGKYIKEKNNIITFHYIHVTKTRYTFIGNIHISIFQMP